MAKRKKNNDMLSYMAFVMGIVILLVLYIFFRNNYLNYNNLKEDKSQFLVYTKATKLSGNYYQYEPYLNIKGELGNVVNEDINKFISNYTDDDISITYESDLSGKVLSLVIKVEDFGYAECATVLNYKSYNINLETLEILTDDKLLGYFEISESEVEKILNNKIEDYYHSLFNEKIVDGSCDFSCFYNNWNFKSYKDYSYFVRDGKLVVFKPYVYMSYSDQESVAKEFIITE